MSGSARSSGITLGKIDEAAMRVGEEGAGRSPVDSSRSTGVRGCSRPDPFALLDDVFEHGARPGTARARAVRRRGSRHRAVIEAVAAGAESLSSRGATGARGLLAPGCWGSLNPRLSPLCKSRGSWKSVPRLRRPRRDLRRRALRWGTRQPLTAGAGGSRGALRWARCSPLAPGSTLPLNRREHLDGPRAAASA